MKIMTYILTLGLAVSSYSGLHSMERATGSADIPLTKAAIDGNLDLARTLLQREPQEVLKLVKVQDKEGKTALHHAVKNPKILALLMPNFITVSGITDNEGKTSLHCAVIEGNLDSVTTLVKSLESQDALQLIKIKDKAGKTALHYGVQNPKILALLMTNFITVSGITDDEGKTALHCAVVEGNLDSVTTLVKSLESQDALQLIKIKDKAGKTALHYGVQNPKILALLMPNFITISGITDNEGKTALQYAVVEGNLDSVTTLVKSLESQDAFQLIKIKDKTGKTALHYGVKNPKILALLMTNFITVSGITDDEGKTALHYAVIDGNLASVTTLANSLDRMDARELKKVKDKLNKTALDYAKETKNAEIIKALE